MLIFWTKKGYFRKTQRKWFAQLMQFQRKEQKFLRYPPCLAPRSVIPLSFLRLLHPPNILSQRNSQENSKVACKVNLEIPWKHKTCPGVAKKFTFEICRTTPSQKCSDIWEILGERGEWVLLFFFLPVAFLLTSINCDLMCWYILSPEDYAVHPVLHLAE